MRFQLIILVQADQVAWKEVTMRVLQDPHVLEQVAAKKKYAKSWFQVHII
jgi:hypothetical protein